MKIRSTAFSNVVVFLTTTMFLVVQPSTANGTDLTADLSDVKGFVEDVEVEYPDVGSFDSGDKTEVKGTITVSNSNPSLSRQCYYTVSQKNFGSQFENVVYDSSMDGMTNVLANSTADMDVNWTNNNTTVTHVIKVRVYDYWGNQVGTTRVIGFTKSP